MRRRRSPQQNKQASITITKEQTSVTLVKEDEGTDRSKSDVIGGINPRSDGGPVNAHNTIKVDSRTEPRRTTFHVAKWMILRTSGVVYLVAFMGAYYQNRGLMGSKGLVPASKYMEYLISQNNGNGPFSGFLDHPTLFWWIPLTDDNMDRVALIGMTLSIIVTTGVDSWLLMLALWILDFSILTIAEGTSFYAYGWESQLLETGFLAIFLCEFQFLRGTWKIPYWRSLFAPRTDSHDNNPPPPASPIILFLFRWLCFRISMGAGLIKVRGSSCWTDKTCLWYHFETQPIPSPLSFLFHFLPKFILTRAVDLDLIVQLYTSWLVLVLPHFLPPFEKSFRWLLRFGGFLQAGFMVNIILSGNFAFLNHLTIIPALACLDDSCWPDALKGLIFSKNEPTVATSRPYHRSPRMLVDLLLFSCIGYLSMPVIDNLLQRGSSRRQIMNGSFDNFRLVNTYGAFGDVGRQRYEAIVQISSDGNHWTELEFPCKPGSTKRRPCFCAPYHHRLDWNIWFLGFQPHQAYLQRREQWLFAFVQKLLDPREHERPWLDLLDPQSTNLLRSLYQSSTPPKYAKVDMYHYQMAFPLWELVLQHGKADHVWWNRTFEEALIPPVQLRNSRLVQANFN